MKEDFPIFKKNKKLIYLDSAATTQKPKQVIDAIKKFYETNNANVHRGIYNISLKASEQVTKARENIAKFINAEPEEIIFTRNATESLNLIAYTLINELESGDEIIISEMEHHSNLVPWQQLAMQKGVKLNFLKVKDKELDLDELEMLLNERTRIVSIVHVSNVLGTINDIKKIREIIGKNVYLIVDGAQAVGHIKVDVKDLDVDFYAFSGHKMFGPSGIGVLYGKRIGLELMKPFLFGGDMISDVKKERTEFNEIPYKFEAGTQFNEGIIGLSEAINYINKISLNKIIKKEEELRDYLIEKIKEVDNIEIYSNEHGIGLVSFNIKNNEDEIVHGHDVAYLLNEDNICVRTGFMCAQPLVQDVLQQNGVIRVSLHYYNDKSDIDNFIKSLKKIVEKFN